MERKKRFHGNAGRDWKRRAQVLLLASAFLGAAAASSFRNTEDAAGTAEIQEIANQADSNGGRLKVESGFFKAKEAKAPKEVRSMLEGTKEMQEGCDSAYEYAQEPVGALDQAGAGVQGERQLIALDMTLSQDMVVSKELIAQSNIDLNGHTLTVQGDLYQTGGKIDINGGTLNVEGDYRIQSREVDKSGKAAYGESDAYLRMDVKGSRINIGGSFITQSTEEASLYYGNNYLSAGIINIKGNFTQLSGQETPGNFQTSPGCKVCFSGTGRQEIYFENPEENYFGNLSFANKSENIVFKSRIRGWTMQEDSEIPEIDLIGDMDLSGHALRIKGSLLQSAGRMDINGGTLTVEGDYRIQSREVDENGEASYGASDAYLQMGIEKSKINIEGSFTTQSTEEANGYFGKNHLSAGIMDIKGNFTQLASEEAASNFQASSGCKVRFSGTGKQEIYFEDPKENYFENPSFANRSENLIFKSGIRGWRMQEDSEIPEVELMGDMDLSGHALHIKGSLLQSAGRMDINGGILTVEGDYRIQSRKVDESGEAAYGASDAYLQMGIEKSEINIEGSFTTQSTEVADSYYGNNYLSAGSMNIKGNFTQLAGGETVSNFQTSSDCKVNLCGNGKQTIFFESYPSSKFSALRLKQPRASYEFTPNPCWDAILCQNIADYEIQLSADSMEYTGNEQKPSVTLQLGGLTLPQGNYRVTYSNNIEIGKATVTVTGIGAYTGTSSKTFMITQREDCRHELSKTEANPATCQTAGNREYYTCAKCGKYFSDREGAAEISLSSVAIPKASHAYVPVVTKATTKKNGSIRQICSFCGNIAGKTVIPYPKTVKLSKTSYVYTGKARKPAVTIKGSDGKAIDSANYTITYSGNKAVGKAMVKITWKGNYTGALSKAFTIKPKGTSITGISAKPKGFSVKWKRQSAQATGYEVQYSSSKSFAKKATVAKNIQKVSTTKLIVKNLKAKKNYYVRVRTYKVVKGTKYASSWSSIKRIKIGK